MSLLRHGCSPVNLLHIFRTSFTENTSAWLLLVIFKSFLGEKTNLMVVASVLVLLPGSYLIFFPWCSAWFHLQRIEENNILKGCAYCQTVVYRRTCYGLLVWLNIANYNIYNKSIYGVMVSLKDPVEAWYADGVKFFMQKHLWKTASRTIVLFQESFGFWF